MAVLNKKRPPPEIEVRRLPDVTLNCWGSEALKSPEKFKKLWDYILLSKTDEKAVIAATNAMSALCAVGYSFSKQDLSGINIPGANLSYGIFYETNFAAANLQGVNFQQAVLNGAILAKANLTDADFGQVNFRLGKGGGTPCCLAIHGKIVAIGEERDPHLRENTQIHVGSISLDKNRPIVKLKSWEHQKTVRNLTFSADGTTLISTSGDGVCKVWDAQTGNQTHKLPTNFILKRDVLDKFSQEAIQELENSGILKSTPTYPNYFEVNIVDWQIFYKTNQDIAEFFWDKIPPRSCAVSDHGELIASVNESGHIYIWNLKTFELVSFITDQNPHGNISFAENENQLIVPTQNSINILDWKTQQIINSYSSQENSYYHQAVLCQDKSQLAARGMGVTVWSSGESIPSKDFSVRRATITSFPNCIAFSSNGELLAIGADKEIRVWNTKNWSPTHYFGGYSFSIRTIGFMEDRHLVVIPACNMPKIYTLVTSQLSQTSPNPGNIKAIALTNDGKRILSLSPYGVNGWDSISGKLKFKLPKVERPSLFYAEKMIVSSCAQHLLLFRKNEAVLWNLETQEEIQSFQRDVIKGVGFLSSGRVAIIGKDSLETYDIDSGILYNCLVNVLSSLSIYCFSEGGRWLAFAKPDGTVIAWDSEGGQMYTLSQVHSSPILSIRICDDTIISQSKVSHIWRPLENWTRSYNKFDEAWTTKSAPNLILFRIGTNLGSYLVKGDSLSLLHAIERLGIFYEIAPTDMTLKDDFGRTRVWSEQTGRFRANFKDAFHFSCLAMHPVLPIVAIGGEEGMIRIWNFTTGKCLDFLKGHKTKITHLVFSKDGSNLLSSSDEGDIIKSWEFKENADQGCLIWQTGSYSLSLDNLISNDVECDPLIEDLLFDEDAKTDQMLALQWLLKNDKNYICRPHVFAPDEASFFSQIESKEYNLEQSIIIINDKILAKQGEEDFIKTLLFHLPLLIELTPNGFEYVLKAIQSVASDIQNKKYVNPVELLLLKTTDTSPYPNSPLFVRDLLDLKLRLVMGRLLDRTNIVSRQIDSKAYEEAGDIFARENNDFLALTCYVNSTNMSPNNEEASKKQKALMLKLNIKL
jgi:WD40 repeat protein